MGSKKKYFAGMATTACATFGLNLSFLYILLYCIDNWCKLAVVTYYISFKLPLHKFLLLCWVTAGFSLVQVGLTCINYTDVGAPT